MPITAASPPAGRDADVRLDAAGRTAPSLLLRARPDPRILVAGVGVAFVRLAFAADRRVFHLFADEPGQLAMARWLSGGSRWTMLDHNTWRPGYALVLAPFAAIVDEGEALVRTALVVNAVLAGLAAMVLTRLLVRWSGLTVATCAAIAAVTALAPATIAASAYTWAESMITLTVLSTLWLLQRFLDTRRLADALGATFLAALALTTHGRAGSLLPVVVVVCCVLLVRASRRPQAVAVLVVGAALGSGSAWLTGRVQAAVWDAPNETNTVGSVVERLDAPTALLDSLAGQAWYQLIASLGAVGIGLGVAVAALVRPRWSLDRTSAAVLLAVTLPPVTLSVAFMSDRARPDQLVYGRYIDTIAWPFCALGIALLVHRARRVDGHDGRYVVPITAIAMAATGLAVAARHGDDLRNGIGLKMMVPGLLPYMSGDHVHVMTITAVALAALGAIAALTGLSADARLRVGVLAVLAATALGFSAVRVHDALADRLNLWAIDDSMAQVDEIVPAGAPVGLVSDPFGRTESLLEQRQRYQVYQLYLSGHDVVWERDPGVYSTRFVFAPFADPGLLTAGAEVRWRDPDKSIALWQLPDHGDARMAVLR